MLARDCWLEFQPKGMIMHSALSYKKSLFSTAVCALLAAAPAKATIYNEAISGDLSNNPLAPTALTLTPGLNSVIGTVNGFPPRWHRPAGLGFIHDSHRLRDGFLCQRQ